MSPTPPPSAWWTLYQVLIKGTNFSHLPIPTADLPNQNIIITGGNSGIGREAALQFARYGANITLGCRSTIPSHEEHPDQTVLACRAAAQESGHMHSTFEWQEIDLASFASVATFATTWLSTNKPLHLLLNNAGVPKKAGVTLTTTDGFELLHQVNFLSHALLTLHLLPSLASAPAPRIIFTTSSLHYIPPFTDPSTTNPNTSSLPYPLAKLHLQTFLTTLQRRLSTNTKYAHITTQGVHPGFVRSGIWAAAAAQKSQTSPSTPSSSSSPPQKSSIANFLDQIPDMIFNALVPWCSIDSQQGSVALVHAAVAAECGMGQGGKFWNRIWEEPALPASRGVEEGRLVWEYLETVLRLREKGLGVGLVEV